MNTSSIKKLTACLIWITILGMGGGNAEGAAPLMEPLGKLRSRLSITTGLAADGAGNLYLAESRQNIISKFDTYGRKVGSFPLRALGEGGLAVTPDGNRLYALAGKSVVVLEGATGAESGRLGTGEGEFGWAAAIDLDRRGHIYVADSDERLVKIYDAQGEFVSQFGGPETLQGEFGMVSTLAVNDAAGEVWVADNLAKGENPGPKIHVFDLDGQFLRVLSGASDFGESPIGKFGALSFDGQGRLYILDPLKNEIRTMDLQTMEVSTYSKVGFLAGRLVGPADLAFDAASVRLFVCSGQQVTILGIDGAPSPVPDIINR